MPIDVANLGNDLRDAVTEPAPDKSGLVRMA
jgi:hypothetical protein